MLALLKKILELMLFSQKLKASKFFETKYIFLKEEYFIDIYNNI